MKWRFITCLILAFCIVLPSATVVAEDTDVSGTISIISDVSAFDIGYYGATISWNTNDNATSQVFYDTAWHNTTAEYAYNTTEDTDPVTEHSIPLTGLSSGTTYHYRVKSAIPDPEFEDISEDYTFKTSSRAPSPTGPAVYYIDTDLFTIEKNYRISRTGEILKTIEAISEDGMLTITIPKGTIALDKYAKRLKSLQLAVDESPPEPPEDADIIGLAYDFGPDGATFDPAITLTWSYDPADVPEGVAEGDLVLAYYDEATGKWIELEGCVVDPVTKTITASVSHFTTFAVIARRPVPPPPPPVPAPAAFSLSNITVKPLEFQPKETVTITVSVANTGGTEGSCTVVLKINGVKEAEKSVTVAAGGSEIVTFSATREEARTYSVVVDGLSAFFIVAGPVLPPTPPPPAPPPPTPPPEVKPPINWPVVGGAIAGVIVVGLLIYFLVVRRRVA